MKKNLLGLVVFCLSMISMTSPAYAVDKVILTPTATVLSETQSTTVQVQLAEPIAGPGSTFVDVNITASDPSRVSISPNPVEYTVGDWFQTKTFTITALDDGIHNASNTVTISFLIDSDSEFYAAYNGSFVLSITDVNPAPVVQSAITTTNVTPVATLADTGHEIALIQKLSLLLFFGFLFLTRRILHDQR